MLQGLNDDLSHELSYDDFVETYGRIGSDSGKSDDWESDELSNSMGARSAIAEAPQVEGDNKNSNSTDDLQSPTPSNSRRTSGDSTDAMEPHPVHYERRRRNSKFQNIASKLSRKSFRLLKKKNSDSAAPTRATDVSPTPSTWNNLFKRSHSASPISQTCQATSCRALPDADGVSHHSTSPVLPSPREDTLTMQRSTSYYSVLSTPIFQANNGQKRKSLTPLPDSVHEEELDFHSSTWSQSITEAGDERESASPKSSDHPAFLPISPGGSPPKPFTPEYDVMKKYGAIREEERMRSIAVVTLLQRRRNSLKLKCAQFEKDLSSGELGEARAKAIQARLNCMKRKLKVVDECVNEQTESMKVSSVKIDLRMSLEVYRMKLLQEEQNGYRCCTPCSREEKIRERLKAPLTSTASCEALQSVDETCVFDDTASVTSLENKDSPFLESDYGRLPSAPYFYTSHSPASQEKSPTDELDRAGLDTVRNRSIDYTVTSDCDSGFDNGDTLSHSDVSLDRILSKSTGSITSVSSHGTQPRSASNPESASPREHCGQYFFHSTSCLTSEQLLSDCNARSRNKTRNREKFNDEVDPNVLATIENFEKFAEKTKRRLSLNGKLVPLKKGT